MQNAQLAAAQAGRQHMTAKASFWELSSWHLTEAIWALSQRTLSGLVCGACFSSGSAESLHSFVSAQCINTAIKQLSPFWLGPWASAGGEARRRCRLCAVPGLAIPHLHPAPCPTGPQPGFAGPPGLFLFFPHPAWARQPQPDPERGSDQACCALGSQPPLRLFDASSVPSNLDPTDSFFYCFFSRAVQACKPAGGSHSCLLPPSHIRDHVTSPRTGLPPALP